MLVFMEVFIVMNISFVVLYVSAQGAKAHIDYIIAFIMFIYDTQVKSMRI
jgi:hypothetical protein